jgi:hypothetical protein
MGTDSGTQILAEFLMDSIAVLEHLANESKPPMKLEDIEYKRSQFVLADSEAVTSVLEQSLAPMKSVFQGRGDVTQWDCDVLAKVDECFTKHYHKAGVLAKTLFFPNNADNQNRFIGYCGDVDEVLRAAGSNAPKYAREYFAYYSIWQLQGLRFPMPLGTASVIGGLDSLLTKYRQGLSEVRIYLLFDFESIDVYT